MKHRIGLFWAILFWTLLYPCVQAMAYQGSWRDDRTLAFDLREKGVKCERGSATVYYEPGAMSEAQMNTFADLADRGVRDTCKFANCQAPDAQVNYFVSAQIEISHSRARSIYLPLARVLNGTAPYLHETVHIVVSCAECPLWLSEGYASYVQSYVSEHMGGYDGQIFTRNGNAGVDRDAMRWLRDERGKAMLPFVGTGEEAPDLSDRRGAAAPFYILSQSLVKYLLERGGFKSLEEVAEAKALAPVREKWLAGILPADQ